MSSRKNFQKSKILLNKNVLFFIEKHSVIFIRILNPLNTRFSFLNILQIKLIKIVFCHVFSNIKIYATYKKFKIPFTCNFFGFFVSFLNYMVHLILFDLSTNRKVINLMCSIWTLSKYDKSYVYFQKSFAFSSFLFGMPTKFWISLTIKKYLVLLCYSGSHNYNYTKVAVMISPISSHSLCIHHICKNTYSERLCMCRIRH